MHVRNVEIFCEVVARRSFSKAAEVHEVSQSSASQAVSQIERHLGMQLIDRSKRPFELTPAGQIYYEGCRELLDGFRKVEERVHNLTNRVTGRLRVAAIYSVGLLQMDAYVSRFEQLYPDVNLRIEYLHPDRVYDNVLTGDADLGLVSFPRDGGEISSIPWQEQPMVLVTSPGHRLARRTSISPDEIDGEEFVGFTSDLSIRKQIDRWLKQVKVAVEIVHEFDNIENIKRAVEIGSGVALLPAPAVARELSLGALSAVRLSGVDWHRPLGIIHRRHNRLSTAAGRFVELLHEDPAEFQRNNGQTVHECETVT